MLKVANSVINASRITGVLPVVNGGTGVTTSTGTGNTVLSATPTLSGDVNLSTGNLVIGTAGKGIDFSATSGTGTSELFADYEEGTWTPAYNTSNSNLTGFIQYESVGKYTKVGNVVTVHCNIATNQSLLIAGTGRIVITGLPYAPSVTGAAGVNFTALTSDNRFINNPSFGQVDNGQTTVNLYKTNAMNTANSLVVADMAAINTANYNLLSFCVTYPVA